MWQLWGIRPRAVEPMNVSSDLTLLEVSSSLTLFVSLPVHKHVWCLPAWQPPAGWRPLFNHHRQWWLIWRGGPGLSLRDSVPNTITPLFRYPAVFYNFAIFQCQGRVFWRVFIEFPAGPSCRGHIFPPRLSASTLLFVHFHLFKRVQQEIRTAVSQILEPVLDCANA